MRQEAKDLLTGAEGDLLVGRHLHLIHDHRSSVLASYQAARKGLEALWVERKRRPSATDDLMQLGRELGAGKVILNRLAVLSSQCYIQPAEEASTPAEDFYDEERSRICLAAANRVITWVVNRLIP